MKSLNDKLTFSSGHQMKNRFMLAPLTNTQSHENGVLSDDEYHWLTKRAKGGFGITMSCASHVQDIGKGFPGQLGIFDDMHIDGLTKLTTEIKKHDSLAIAQLHHAGMRSPEELINTQPVCPSDDSSTGARSLSTEEVIELRNDFIVAAVRAKTSGYPGVEIHGAHGYLIDNFFWSGTNIREDEYGGSIENRSQFVSDIIKSVRENVSENFIVGLRFSQWKQHDFEAKLAVNPEEHDKVLIGPVNCGLDYVHSSMRRFWEKEFENSEENLAYWTKKITKIPTIGVGSVGLDSDFVDMTAPASPTSIERAIEDISKNKYDMIAVGRALLSDPEWVLKMKEGRLNDVIPYTKEALLNLY